MLDHQHELIGAFFEGDRHAMVLLRIKSGLKHQFAIEPDLIAVVIVGADASVWGASLAKARQSANL